MQTLIHQRVQAAHAGTNPYVICRMPSGWAVLGDQQFVSGYSLLLSDPVVPDVNHLNEKSRLQFLRDMTLIGDALLAVTDAFRINYEILGNDAPALHAHIFPRYMSESEESRGYPVWMAYVLIFEPYSSVDGTVKTFSIKQLNVIQGIHHFRNERKW